MVELGFRPQVHVHSTTLGSLPKETFTPNRQRRVLVILYWKHFLTSPLTCHPYPCHLTACDFNWAWPSALRAFSDFRLSPRHPHKRVWHRHCDLLCGPGPAPTLLPAQLSGAHDAGESSLLMPLLPQSLSLTTLLGIRNIRRENFLLPLCTKSILHLTP